MIVPGKFVSSIYEIDLDDLWGRGFRAIITDLDNTLVGWNEPAATPKLLAWLAKARERGFRVCIVSNNKGDRVEEFARPLSIPFISAARKPRREAFRRALGTVGCTAEEAVMIGDQLFTDVMGGNRSGLYTILVRPVHPHEWIGTRFMRRLERLAFIYLRLRGYMSKEESR